MGRTSGEIFCRLLRNFSELCRWDRSRFCWNQSVPIPTAATENMMMR